MPDETAAPNPGTTTAAAAQPAATLSLLDSIVEKGKMARDVSQQPHARDLVGEFANQVLTEGMTINNIQSRVKKGRIAQID